MLHIRPLVRPLSVCIVSIVVAAAPGVARAQNMFDAKTAAFVRDKYLGDLDSVHVKIVALANAIPESKYAWRPAPGVRSVSEVFMHLAGEWYYYGPLSVSGKAPADFGKPDDALKKLESITRKSEVLEQLNKSWAHCHQQISGADASQLTGKYKPWGVTLPEAAFGMTGDQHEHLGQLIAYARSVGVKPPWSK